MEGCTVIEGHARFEAPDACRRRRRAADGAPHLHQRGRPRRSSPTCRASTTSRSSPTRRSSRSTSCREHLVVVGGSYIGLEFAQMYRRFGAEVTVVEKAAAPDRARGRRRLRRDPRHPGRARASRSAPAPSASASSRTTAGRRGRRLDCAEGAPEVVGSHVLLAVGRRPNTDDLGLEQAGRRDRRARLHHRRRRACATNVPGIWALGRLQRARRLHPHRLQRLRDRRRQPAGRRAAPRQRPRSRPTRSTSTRRSGAWA